MRRRGAAAHPQGSRAAMKWASSIDSLGPWLAAAPMNTRGGANPQPAAPRPCGFCCCCCPPLTQGLAPAPAAVTSRQAAAAVAAAARVCARGTAGGASGRSSAEAGSHSGGGACCVHRRCCWSQAVCCGVSAVPTAGGQRSAELAVASPGGTSVGGERSRVRCDSAHAAPAAAAAVPGACSATNEPESGKERPNAEQAAADGRPGGAGSEHCATRARARVRCADVDCAPPKARGLLRLIIAVASLCVN
jgi:hypothetical protein